MTSERTSHPPSEPPLRWDLAIDAALYGASALFCGAMALWAEIPIYREGGRITAAPYAAGAIVALVLAGMRARPHPLRLRVGLALAVMAGALVLPLALEVTWRAHTQSGLHAQAEAIIVEEAARALVHGRDPYAVSYARGPLEARPPGTTTHVPYLPGMLLFGLPRALAGDHAGTDARVWFATATLAIGALALGGPRSGLSGRDRLRAFQFLAVLPTGALLLAGGGDDLPVLALLLLSVTLTSSAVHQIEPQIDATARRTQRLAASGLAAGLAGALKQLAWPVTLFLGVVVWRRADRPTALRWLALAAGVPLAVTLPFLLWDPGAFIEDVVRFPLGLGRQRSPAQAPTIGSVVIRWAPSARVALIFLFAGVVVALVAWLIARRPPGTAAEAARSAGLVFQAAVILAPSARFAYLIYPLNLLLWAWLVRPGAPSTPPTERDRSAGAHAEGSTFEG